MKTSATIIQWSARVICLLGILFLSMFALDAFDSSFPVWKKITDFLIHLIPSFILLALLFLAWRKELTGGILFLTLGALMAPFIYSHNYQMNHSIRMSLVVVLLINAPFIVTGILFILSSFLKRPRIPS